MTDLRTITARTLVAALVLSVFSPAHATVARAAQPQPTPIEAPTVTPLAEVATTPIPYPAYGSPAPDVAAQQPKANVPTTVSLIQAIDIAVIGSPEFASERAQYSAIRAKYNSEKQAFFPNISGTASIERDYGGNGGGATPAPSAHSMNTSIGGSLNVEELIFDGGRVIAALRSAREGDLAGRDTLVRQLQTLGDTVATQYYAVLEDTASVRADAKIVNQFEEEENSVRGQIAAGAAARSALAAAQFESEQARGTLITAQGALIAAQSTFATTLGLDADTAITPQPLTTVPGPKLNTYLQSLSAALELRPDYLAAVYTLEAARQGVRYAELARIPSITANASDGYSEQLPESTPKFVHGESLGATLSIPIYDQGLTSYNIAVAKSQYDQANAALIETKLQVESDVRGSLSNLISARAALVEAQSELASGEVNLQATQATYKVGAATITDLVTAEATLATAQRDQIAALYGERLAEYTYTYAMGTSDLKL